MRKLTIFSFALAFCMLTSLQAQVNEFDSEVKLNSVKKDLKPSFELISVKLNNKMYSTSQLKGLNTLSYKQNQGNDLCFGMQNCK